MRVIFEAFDGTTFFDEDECRLYELQQEAEKVEKNMILLDHYGGVITEPFSEIDLNEVFTIAVGNQKVAEFLENYFVETGTHRPKNGFEENTVYWWDDEKIEWLNVGEKIAELESEIEFFEEKLALLEQI
jgi:hypothetical protein